jgi:NAD+ kinase
MKIAVFGNIYRPVITSHIRAILDFFGTKNVTLMLDNELYEFFVAADNCCIDHIEIIKSDNFAADIAISIGGDGTFLNTAARVGDKNIPILGINTGRLGFLADVSGENILQALEAISNNLYTIEERILLQVVATDGTHFEYPNVLNDVSILKQDSSSMIGINVSLNGNPVNSYQADGLIISTPTGSTAYSMSVGGPLLVPEAENIILSPVASHSLNVRPLVVPDTWIIDLDVSSRTQSYMISLDGRTKVLEQSTRLQIRKAPYKLKVIRQLNHTFFDTLKSKLMWGVDKRN